MGSGNFLLKTGLTENGEKTLDTKTALLITLASKENKEMERGIMMAVIHKRWIKVFVNREEVMTYLYADGNDSTEC